MNQFIFEPSPTNEDKRLHAPLPSCNATTPCLLTRKHTEISPHNHRAAAHAPPRNGVVCTNPLYIPALLLYTRGT